jgi:hypothetical protein
MEEVIRRALLRQPGIPPGHINIQLAVLFKLPGAVFSVQPKGPAAGTRLCSRRTGSNQDPTMFATS